MGTVMLSLLRTMASAPPPNTETTSTQPMLKASVTGQGGPNHARTEVGVHEAANRHRGFHEAPAGSLSIRAALEIAAESSGRTLRGAVAGVEGPRL